MYITEFTFLLLKLLSHKTTPGCLLMTFLCKMFDSTTRPIHTFKTIYAPLNEQLFLYTVSNLIILILITHRENSQAVIIYCVGCFPFTLEISVIKLFLESENFSTPKGYRLESLIFGSKKNSYLPSNKVKLSIYQNQNY